MKRNIVFLFTLLTAAGLSFAQVQQSPEGFRQEGIASWYGTEFDGRATASGEIFNSKLFTAAHPNLPFGTILTITNTQNGKKVNVRVNDRGPFVSARIIDLSRAAAEQLDMISTGTAPVLVESTTALSQTGTTQIPSQPEQPPASALPAAVSPAPSFTPESLPALAVQIDSAAGSIKSYRVQVGSYKVPKNAVNTFDKLKGAGLNPAYERNGDYFRVVLAGIRGEDVQSLRERLGAAGFGEVLLREER
jgi:rare lipoprotein A